MTSPADDIELADAVEAVRDGLLVAASRGSGSPLHFEVGDIQMEFSVELRRDFQGRAGVKAWIANISAEGSVANTRVQKVAFTLKPKNSTTKSGWEISNESEGDASKFKGDD
ncbi:trypco2 family protein [Actinacidiphila bryophytorum]|uniref:Trypsin-co-occurring domain-containing protein n=1 Tax=Actinacidiphila bryophytorum TaxID=1436133 RepID=A0A9W4EDZ9_9ACTN|nr:trypco2 family protein [Actinacidiphila bryophytorum]MBM9436062.1 hypothetical protein [Actinacidiphila bryophytorum]MBN6542138.1 hypothetical protein [Actinacidiphila bryophytorum]CAG7634809.1 conserved hypothetical protein [Actinacidiphila bryophytorum]